MTIYFGPRWYAPILDDATEAVTPIGVPCLRCREPIAAGDQGLMMPVVRSSGEPINPVALADPDGNVLTVEPIHAECEAIGIVGHQYGICSCTGYDTTSRAAARELWRRVGHIE